MQNDKMDAKAERQEFVKRQEFERLVRENQSGLLAFLFSLTGNLPDREDLAQECALYGNAEGHTFLYSNDLQSCSITRPRQATSMFIKAQAT